MVIANCCQLVHILQYNFKSKFLKLNLETNN